MLARKELTAEWTFKPMGLNSLRLDAPTLTIVYLPRRAELSIQSQLVRGLRINDTPVDLCAAPADRQFDFSYRRVPVTKLLRVGENRIEAELTEPKPLKFLPALILWGDFAVDAQGRLIAPPRMIGLGDWRTQGYPVFCGTGCYTATVSVDAPPRRLELDSGGYPARVIWNGRDLGLRCWPPFAFDLTIAARAGRNTVEVRVTSTLGHVVTPAASPPIGLMGACVQPQNS